MLAYLKDRLAIFKSPPFRKFFIAEFCASFANGFIYIANTWLVISIGHTLVAVIWSFLSYWVPRALFLPVAGVVIDRVNRKYFVSCLFIIMGLCFGGFGVILHFFPQLHLLWICVFYAILGAMGAFFMPAIMAFMREIVANEDLLYANANLDFGFQTSNILGIGLCGYMLHLLGFTISYLIMMGLFAFSGFVVLLISSKRLHVTAVKQRNVALLKQFWFDIHTGLRYILTSKRRLVLYLAQLFLLSILMVSPALLAPFAKTVLHANVLEYGHIEFSMAIGMMFGGVLLIYLAGVIGSNFVLLFSTILLILSLLGFSMVKTVMWGEIAYLLMGFSLGSWAILASMAQALTDRAYQGRVQSLFNFLTAVVIILLYLFVQLASGFLTIRHIYWIVSGLGIIPIALMVFYYSYFKQILKRRKWASSEKSRVVLEGIKGRPVAEICTRHIISQSMYVILPVVGLVWWFILKSPMEFMFTCIGVALLWTGIGLGYFFFSYGKAKLCSCSSCLCPITSKKKK